MLAICPQVAPVALCLRCCLLFEYYCGPLSRLSCAIYICPQALPLPKNFLRLIRHPTSNNKYTEKYFCLNLSALKLPYQQIGKVRNQVVRTKSPAMAYIRDGDDLADVNQNDAEF